MKLSLKLSLIMGALALTIAGSNLFSIYQLNRVNMTSTELANEWMPAIVAIEEVNTLFSDFRIAEIQHAIATDDRVMDDYEQQLAALRNEFAKRLKVYESIHMSEDEKKLYNEFRRTQDAYIDVHDKVIALSRQHKTAETMALLNGKCRDIYLESTKVLVQLVESNLKGGREVSEAGDTLYTSASFSLSTILVVSLLISIGLTVVVVRGIQQQLGKDPGDLASIASRVTRGDYDIDDGTPRIGVYGNIVGMVEALKDNIFKAREESQRAHEESEKATKALASAETASAEARRKSEAILRAADRLEQVATIVSSASTELSAQIEESERGAAQQAARVAETATAMEEMNSTVLEVAHNAGTASEVSSTAREKAESGARIVSEAVESILRVQQVTGHLRGEMVTLDENAQAISRIMDVISDIADQTNLLALNAAIEAARAGEAGRGFAVVADEVRKLAEKTMASTTDVGNAIRTIQQNASQNMVDMDTSVKVVEQATLLASQSGDALREIVTMIDNTADQVRAIATASEQQSASSEEINQSIIQVNTIASETAIAMGEAAHAVSDLAAQAQVLKSLIEEMKRG